MLHVSHCLTEETTDIADRSKLAIFIRFVHSDSHEVAEEFFGLVQVFYSKCAEVLCQKVVLLKKVDIEQMRFTGLYVTNTMSGEVSGLQTRLRHLSPHANYINCWNHRLHLIFVHLLKENESLSNVDTFVISVEDDEVFFCQMCSF